MTNMIPQSPANNREVWRELEEYSRDLVSQGKELYIVAGGEGKDKAIAEQLAKDEGLGVWNGSHQKPWEFRRKANK